MIFFHRATKHVLLCLITLVFGLKSNPLFAKTHTEYYVKHYTDEDGLPQNSIRGIRQDASGFIWLATEDGLTRFDGHNFFVFNSENSDFTSNRFVTIQDNITSNGLYAYNINGEYVRIANGKVYRDREHRYGYNDVTAFLTSNQISLPEAGRVGDNAVITPAAGSFYLVGNRHLYNFRNRELVSMFPFKEMPEMYYGERNRMFSIGTSFYYYDDDGTFYVYNGRYHGSARLTGDILYHKNYQAGNRDMALYFNGFSNATLLLFRNSLYALEKQNENTLNTRLLLSDFNFEESKIVSAYFDPGSENVFLGSKTSGLYVCTKMQFQTYTSGDKKQQNAYYAQDIYDDNTILTSNGDLLSNAKPPQRLFAGNNTYNQYTLAVDSEKNIWVTRSSLLSKYDHQFKLLRSWKTPPSPILLYEGLNSKMWICTRGGDILYIDRIHPDSLHMLPLKIPGVSFLIQQKPEELWMASRWGLYRLHLNTMQMDTVKKLNGQYVRSLYFSGPDLLWITTYETGFYLYTNNSLTHFPLDNDHFMAAAHCIVEDKDGYFWISTNKGLFEVKKDDLLAYAANKQQELFYMYYNKTKGFLTNEFNGGGQPCGVRLKNGDITFPSLNGMVWLSPANVQEQLPDKNIFLDKVEINGINIGTRDSIDLKQHVDRLNIWISTPYFGNRKNVHLSYSLQTPDYKQSFIKVPATGVIALQNLSPGDYILCIRKVNGFGKNNFSEKNIFITVPPYWYQTTWFAILVAALILIGVYLAVTGRTRFLLRKNRLLEITIRKRTQKLEQTLTSLKTSQDALAKQNFIQERLIAAISHDIRTPLKYLNFSNRKIYEQLQQLTTDADLLELSKNAASSSGRMHHYLANLLQYVKTNVQKGSLHSDYFDLHHLVQEHVALLTDAATANGSVIENKVPDEIFVFTNRQLLGIILHNLLDNAVKITVGGCVWVDALETEDKTTIIVGDNGGGIPAAFQNWINQPGSFFDTPNMNELPTTGLGLFIVKEFSILIDATLYMESDNKTYTKVQIAVPPSPKGESHHNQQSQKL